MSNRIDQRFALLATASRKALVPFITAGDPSPEWTVALMHRLVESGADLIELGVPFSDPTADGPVIQAASERSISRGVNLRSILGMVAEFRRTDADTPVVLMGYLNPIERFGIKDFAKACSEAGVDGLLTVDCPPEELGRFGSEWSAAGIYPIFLVAPTTSQKRLEQIARSARGFVYYVSFKGITGAASLDVTSPVGPVASIRTFAKSPVLVGFGIKDPESASACASCADGVVIGSALVSALAEANSVEDALRRADTFLAPIRRAMDNTSRNSKVQGQ